MIFFFRENVADIIVEDIVGREYIISSNFMPPYGILLADSTITHTCHVRNALFRDHEVCLDEQNTCHNDCTCDFFDLHELL
jgi:hypothetical protein